MLLIVLLLLQQCRINHSLSPNKGIFLRQHFIGNSVSIDFVVTAFDCCFDVSYFVVISIWRIRNFLLQTAQVTSPDPSSFTVSWATVPLPTDELLDSLVASCLLVLALLVLLVKPFSALFILLIAIFYYP